MRKTSFAVTFVILLLSFPLYSQAFLPDLERGDLDSVGRKLSLLGTDFAKQPLLALYLQNPNPNPEVVEQLIQRGANVNMVSPKSKLPPLYMAVTSRQTAQIVRILLANGAKIDLAFAGAWGKTILDYALGDEQYQTASLLLKANAALPAKVQQSTDKRYATRIALLADNVDKAKAAITSGELPQKQIWKIALAGDSRKIIEVLVKLYDVPEMADDDLRFLAGNTDLLEYMVSIGFAFSSDQLQTADLYEYLIEQRNLASIAKIRSMDLVPRPQLYQAALDAGIEYLGALTRGFTDLTPEDLYDDGLAASVYEKTDETTALSLIDRSRPNAARLLNLYARKPTLFAAIVNSDSTGAYSLKEAGPDRREQAWQLALQNNDIKGMTALAKIDPDISARIASVLLKQNPTLLVQLLALGLKLNDSDALWYDAIDRGQADIYVVLLKVTTPPSDIVRRSTRLGDQALFALLKAGYQISSSEIDWDSLIKEDFSSSLVFLSQNGFQPPPGAVLTAFAYNQTFFLSLPKEVRQLTRDQLGTITVEYDGGGRLVKRLGLEVAIDKGFLDSIVAMDKDFKVFEPYSTSPDPASYPVNTSDSPRGRKALKYFAVIAGHPAGSGSNDYLTGEKAERGYGPDGYNDFLTNNFNILSFLIAVKYDQRAIAQYILSRDPSIRNASIFSRDELQGLGVYKIAVIDFVSKKYRNNATGKLLQGGGP